MHIEKYNRSAVGHILQHIENKEVRAKRDNVNPDLLDTDYSLCDGGIASLKTVLRDTYVSPRKDVNVLCSCIVTAPKNLPKDREKEFFYNAYNFLGSRYKSPIISAFVHRSEPNAQSHLHFCFCPVVYDKKKDRYKVCAKEVITKQDLQTLHQDFKEYCFQKMGLELDILDSNNATKQNLSINELKYQSLKQEIDKLNKLKNKIVFELERCISR